MIPSLLTQSHLDIVLYSLNVYSRVRSRAIPSSVLLCIGSFADTCRPDTGIGMTPEELTTNLGTLAKSGTSEFLSKAESDTSGNGNLIGAFGLGFYSSFLVADRVQVASLAAESSKNPNPTQYVFNSGADENSFEIFPDPRGNTLGRGTEITLFIQEDAHEYLVEKTVKDLVYVFA